MRRCFKHTNAPSNIFLLRSLIHREIVQLLHFFIAEANLEVVAPDPLKDLATEISGFAYHEASRMRSSVTSLLSDRKSQKLVRFFSNERIQYKAKEYIPRELRRFLNWFILKDRNRRRILTSFRPTSEDKRIYRYVLCTEHQVDRFRYDPALSHYLEINYKSEITNHFRSYTSMPCRHSSVSSVNYIGRRGSYEILDQAPVSYIYLIGLGACTRHDPFRTNPSSNVMVNDLQACKQFYQENYPRVTIVLSDYQIIPAIQRHPFPNFRAVTDFKDYRGDVAIPGTLSMKTLSRMRETSNIHSLKIFGDISEYFYESLIVDSNIDDTDIIRDLYGNLDSSMLQRIYSAF